MTARDRIRWDRRYRERSGPFPNPDPLLYDYSPPISPIALETLDKEERPRALDLACGVGQNGLWLAKENYSVDLLDISRTALIIAQEEAMRRGLRTLNFMQADLDEVALKSEAYDLVCVFRYLRRDLFPRIRECVRPGGRVIYSTYNTGYLLTHPDFKQEYVVERGELISFFPGWKIVHQRDSDEVSELVVNKPK